MSDSEKPKSWKERKRSIKHKWLMPLIFTEWLCERLSYLLGKWALLDICGHIGRFGVLASIIVGVCVYVMEADERRMKAENERQQAVDQRKANTIRRGRLSILLKEDEVAVEGKMLSKICRKTKSLW
jgi:hypothetical protein